MSKEKHKYNKIKCYQTRRKYASTRKKINCFQWKERENVLTRKGENLLSMIKKVNECVKRESVTNKKTKCATKEEEEEKVTKIEVCYERRKRKNGLKEEEEEKCYEIRREKCVKKKTKKRIKKRRVLSKWWNNALEKKKYANKFYKEEILIKKTKECVHKKSNK